ncbi:MAG: prolyl oligopeptidase family serine peptidase [Candidatus Methanomethylicia archaeon]
MKLGVKIKRGTVYIEKYKEGEEYADVLIDKYNFLRDLEDPRTLSVIKKAKKEFSLFIKENIDHYKRYKKKLMLMTQPVKAKSVPYSGEEYELSTVYKGGEILFILKTQDKYLYLSTSEKDKKNICGYFEYIGESKYGLVYTITEDYSDNKVLLYRSFNSSSIDNDIVIDYNVNFGLVHDNLVFYVKHHENYFSPKYVYAYDLVISTKSKIFEVKSKNVNDMIEDIYFDRFSQRVVIVKKSGTFRNLIYYDIKSNKSVDFFSYNKVSYSFSFTQSDVLVLYTNTDDYSYLYLVNKKNFYTGTLKSPFLISAFSKSDKEMIWFGANDRFLFYCFKHKDLKYNLQVVDLNNLQSVYNKVYDDMGIEDIQLYDDCWHTKDLNLALIIKIIYSAKVSYVYVYVNNNEVKEEIVERDIYNLENPHDKYVVKREFVDGIPVDICYLDNGKPKKGAIVEVYGAYGSVINTSLGEIEFALLDDDYIVAFGRVRGGGDLGKRWHEQGKLLNKMNTINDTITVCKYISDKYLGGKNNIVLKGVSAGGIAVGGALNKKPDLFKGVILQMAFVDVLNTMLDESQPLTKLEYEEWGNPRKAKYYYYIKSYCPYTNIKSQSYPNVLIVSGKNDDRVMMHEGLKFYMKLKEYNISDSRILYYITPTGHFFGDDKRSRIKTQAYILTFIKKCLD